jgi:hypothetical protein
VSFVRCEWVVVCQDSRYVYMCVVCMHELMHLSVPAYNLLFCMSRLVLTNVQQVLRRLRTDLINTFWPSRNLRRSRRFRLWITGDDQSQPIGRRDSRGVPWRKRHLFRVAARMLRENPQLAELGTTTRYRRNPVMDLVTLDLPVGRKQPSCYRPPHDVGGRSSPQELPNNLTSDPHR